MPTPTLHTSAPFTLVRSYLRPGEADIMHGTTPQGEPDCIYGWCEPQSTSDCLPHLLVRNASDEALKHVALVLIGLGYQVVVTDRDDWSITDPDMPIRYDWQHGH